MDHLKMHSMNKIDGNIAKIATLFPNCVTEAKSDDGSIIKKIDFDMLKQELSNSLIEGREERYQFTWPDKKQAILTANTPINKTLRPCRNESVNYDKTKNLYIEGDNIEVLKLLQETYLGKIQVIYIDPPYNTGKDEFVYDDDFSINNEEYLSNSGQFDLDGNKLVENTENNGRFHTNWLNMMYSRLKLAKDLLSNDGIIFISIDDNEVENLIKICDEIFGIKNRIEIFHIQVRYGNKQTRDIQFLPVMEYVLMYTKSKEDYSPNLPYEDYGMDKFIYEITETEQGEIIDLNGEKVQVFKKGQWKIKKHEKGAENLLKEVWITGSIYSDISYGKVYQKIVEPRVNIDGYGSLYKIFGRGEDGLGYRYYTNPQKEGATKGKTYSGIPLTRLEEIKNGGSKQYKPITNYYDYSPDFGNIRSEGGIAFNSGKKPVKMLKEFINLHKDKNVTVLDFFSGSGSTAHAVMQLNKDDGGNRKFIMVQIPQICEENSDAYKAGFKNICELGKQRLRNAGQKIISLSPENKEIDIGFRVLKCDTTNMEDVYYTPDHIDTNDLFKNNIKSDRTGEDLLFQTMLDLGILLSSKIETKKINSKEVFCVEGNYLMACFDDSVDEKTITEIAKEKPYYFVMRDPANSKDGDSLITNFEQIFATYSPDTVRKVL